MLVLLRSELSRNGWVAVSLFNMTVLRAATLGRAGIDLWFGRECLHTCPPYLLCKISSCGDRARCFSSRERYFAYSVLEDFIFIACPQKFGKRTEPTEEFKP
jgi:hypothetical protein